MLKSGIYQIKNKYNGNMYVGSAKDVNKRLAQHRRYLQNNKHPNTRMQSEFNEHDEDFVFQSIYITNYPEALKLEQIFIDTGNYVYNIKNVPFEFKETRSYPTRKPTGRPKKYSKEELDNALNLLESHTYDQVSFMTGISVSSLTREKRNRK